MLSSTILSLTLHRGVPKDIGNAIPTAQNVLGRPEYLRQMTRSPVKVSGVAVGGQWSPILHPAPANLPQRCTGIPGSLRETDILEPRVRLLVGIPTGCRLFQHSKRGQQLIRLPQQEASISKAAQIMMLF